MNLNSSQLPDYVEEKRRIFGWFLRWINNDANIEPVNFDLPQMTMVMQLLGFKLLNFEKLNEASSRDDSLSVKLECNKSGMYSILRKDNSTCTCPATEDVEKSRFWTVTGYAPSSQENINVSTSSLLPTLSKSKSTLTTALVNGAFYIINSEAAVENVESLPNVPETSSPFTRSSSLDTFKTPALRKGLKRQHSWEVDPKTSPPTQTSSPIPSLCATLEHVSLNERRNENLLDNLNSIKKLVENSIEIAHATKNATFTKTSYKRVSDIKPADSVTSTDAIVDKTVDKGLQTPQTRLIKPTQIKKSNGVLSTLNPKTNILRNRVISLKRNPINTPKTASTTDRLKTPINNNGVPGPKLKVQRRDSPYPVTPSPSTPNSTHEEPTTKPSKPALGEYSPMIGVPKHRNQTDEDSATKPSKPEIGDYSPMIGVPKSRIASYVKQSPKLVYRVSNANENDNKNRSSGRFKNIVKAKSAIAKYKPKQ